MRIGEPNDHDVLNIIRIFHKRSKSLSNEKAVIHGMLQKKSQHLAGLGIRTPSDNPHGLGLLFASSSTGKLSVGDAAPSYRSGAGRACCSWNGKAPTISDQGLGLVMSASPITSLGGQLVRSKPR
ncbi:hypothetical protein ACCQ08_24935 [Comamonas sp. SY3]|uniref:hypothetical protein n=1 Tax=Comamonas sp. SY3 TaxID=3243601 RepID=UPI003594648B